MVPVLALFAAFALRLPIDSLLRLDALVGFDVPRRSAQSAAPFRTHLAILAPIGSHVHIVDIAFTDPYIAPLIMVTVSAVMIMLLIAHAIEIT